MGQCGKQGGKCTCYAVGNALPLSGIPYLRVVDRRWQLLSDLDIVLWSLSRDRTIQIQFRFNLFHRIYNNNKKMQSLNNNNKNI